MSSTPSADVDVERPYHRDVRAGRRDDVEIGQHGRAFDRDIEDALARRAVVRVGEMQLDRVRAGIDRHVVREVAEAPVVVQRVVVGVGEIDVRNLRAAAVERVVRRVRRAVGRRIRIAAGIDRGDDRAGIRRRPHRDSRAGCR